MVSVIIIVIIIITFFIFMLAECSETTCNNVSKTTEGKKIQIIEIQINAKCNSVNALE